MLRIIGLVFVILAGAIVVAAGVAFWLTSGPVKAADAFFAASARDPAAGYDLAAPSFKSATSVDDWAAFVRSRGLAQYQRASWGSRSVENGVANLSGSLTLRRGSLPIEVQLTHGPGGWKVLHVSSPVSGADQAGSLGATPRIPPAQVAQLCRANLAAQAGVAFDGIVCAGPLPAVAGRQMICAARKGPRELALHVTVEAYAPATRHFDLDCKVSGAKLP